MIRKIIKAISMASKNDKNCDEQRSFARRDRLLEIEKTAQLRWESEGTNLREVDPSRKKYMITFPYPYMNGRLHLGHGFSMSKAEFVARYKTLKGFNVLFPMGFHCTGMPISAAALKIKEEIAQNGGLEKSKSIMEKRKKGELSFEDQPITQYEILIMNGVSHEDISNFADPIKWITHFPGKGKEDLKKFGIATDFRRSFITTDRNKFYDSFIKWQFRRLKEGNYLKFGKRPAIYSPKDNQMCADHDRSEGEGVLPQEYTLIKMKLMENKEKLLNSLNSDDKVYLVAATLRPETMYGQTNCFVLPDGEYGLYKMKNGEFWVCSHQSSRNMAYQDLFNQVGKPELVAKVLGKDLLGLPVHAPLSKFEKVYVLPMLSISMSKGTGVVTSVPSDSPDDYAVLCELKKKTALREKFRIPDEAVLPFEPVAIISSPKFGDLAAVTACEQFKVTSMNDREKLALAKEEVYLDGFYNGKLILGEFAGKTVQEAKVLVKNVLLESGEAVKYYEPEGKCTSRSGDTCVVALCDQWYITYGEEPAKTKLKERVSSSEFNTYNDQIKTAFLGALDWLKEWGCSRSFGMGTKLPWDEQYLIESLSDSTIYMAYYTICSMLHRDLYGDDVIGAPASEFGDNEWNYIFLGKPLFEKSNVDISQLDAMRKSFEYWYPFDLRCSGKDLVKNHLTMSLYNHEYIWGTAGKDNLPRGFFCNGWVLVDREKMSKQKGNFILLNDAIEQYGADSLRLALALAGDTLDDANVEIKSVDGLVLRLSSLDNWYQELPNTLIGARTGVSKDDMLDFYDRLFNAQIRQAVSKCEASYDKMVFRDVIKDAFYTLVHAREDYRLSCGAGGMHRDLLLLYAEIQLLLIFPITPHFSEIIYSDVYLPTLNEEERSKKATQITKANFPVITVSSSDKQVLAQADYLQKLSRSVRSSLQKINKKSKGFEVKRVTIVVADNFMDWQLKVLEELRKLEFSDKGEVKGDWKAAIKELNSNSDKNFGKKSMEFASHRLKSTLEEGPSALASNLPFDEYVILNRYIDQIFRGMTSNFEKRVIVSKDALMDGNKNVVQAAQNCIPGNPAVILETSI